MKANLSYCAAANRVTDLCILIRRAFSVKNPFPLLLLLLALCFGARAQGQTARTLTGIVTDSLQRKPLKGATVQLFGHGQQPAGAAVLTAEDGRFRLPLTDTGGKSVTISYSGLEPKRLPLPLSGDELGTIALAPEWAKLGGVTVTGQRKLIEQTDDKIVYNVENDPVAKSQTAIDLLRRTPFVSVDANNNVRLNGQTNFKVLLNGRETAMFAQNVSEALQGFPGSSIMKIEVITSPSAKYDAEGIGGIINIITKKKIEGYNGSVSTWSTSINQHVFGTNFNAKVGKVGISLNYRALANIRMPSFSTSTTLPNNTSFYSRRVLEGDQISSTFSNNGSGEISFAVDSMHTVSLYGNVSGGNSRVETDQQVSTYFSNSPDPFISELDRLSRRRFPTRTIGTDFIKKYSGKPDKEFSIRFNSELGNSNSFFESEETAPSFTRFIINNSIGTNRQYTLQSDYIHPLPNATRLEVGARATLRLLSSDFESQIKHSPNDNYKLNPGNTDNFRFFQDVYSVYGSYSFKLKNFSFRTGLRVEQTFIDGDFQSSKAFAKNSYTNILPNFLVSRKIQNLVLGLSYNQRLQRPHINYLNPFIDNNDSLNISFGNPDLDAQTLHTVTFQSRLQKGKTFMGITTSGSFSNNMIVNLVSFNPANGVRTSTYQNVGRDFLLSVNGNINTKFGDKWSYFTNINFQFRKLKNKKMPEQRNSGIGGNTNIGVSYINKRLVIDNYVGFEQSIIDLQSRPNTIPYCGSGINYQVIADKLRVGLMGQNYFAKRYDYITRIIGTDFGAPQVNRYPMGKVVLTVNWNFGKLKENTSKKKGVTKDELLGE